MKDGGPDVTIVPFQGGYEIYFGKSFWHTLFAGMAMQALAKRLDGSLVKADGSWITCAALSYQMADAMIAERERREQTKDAVPIEGG